MILLGTFGFIPADISGWTPVCHILYAISRCYTELHSRNYLVIFFKSVGSCTPHTPISANVSAILFRRRPCENRNRPLVRHSGEGRNPVKRACDTNPPNWDSYSQLTAFSSFASTLSIASPAESRTPCSHGVRTKPSCEHHSIL